MPNLKEKIEKVLKERFFMSDVSKEDVDALLSLFHQLEDKVLKSVPENICPLPEQYGDKCENCDGILDFEACQCHGHAAARHAVQEVFKGWV